MPLHSSCCKPLEFHSWKSLPCHYTTRHKVVRPSNLSWVMNSQLSGTFWGHQAPQGCSANTRKEQQRSMRNRRRQRREWLTNRDSQWAKRCFPLTSDRWGSASCPTELCGKQPYSSEAASFLVPRSPFTQDLFCLSYLCVDVCTYVRMCVYTHACV